MKKYFYTLLFLISLSLPIELFPLSHRLITRAAKGLRKPVTLLCSAATFLALSRTQKAARPFLSTTGKDLLQALSLGCAATAASTWYKKEQEVSLTGLGSAYLLPLVHGVSLHINTKLYNYCLKKEWPTFFFDTETPWDYKTIICALAAVQTAAYFYEKEPKQDGIYILSLLIKELQLDNFLDVLLTTEKEELQINFPHQKVALSYFLKEYEITKNERALSYIQGLKDGTLSVLKDTFIIDVAAARQSNFFIEWILGMQTVATKNQQRTSYTVSIKHQANSYALLRLPYAPYCPYLTFRTFVDHSLEFFDDLLLAFKQYQKTKKRIAYKPLLA